MKSSVVLVYDRKKTSSVSGIGKIELRIGLSRTCRKTILIGECAPTEWKRVSKSSEIRNAVAKYQHIVEAMRYLGEEMTLQNFNKHAGFKEKEVKEEEIDFIAFMSDAISKEKIAEGTRRYKKILVETVTNFGKIKKVSDLTTKNISAFDQWLRENGSRADTTICDYHKRLHKYIKQVHQLGYIERDPYDTFKYPRGKYKERQPLTEEELKVLRDLKLPPKEDRVRDLFIFSAYTGLAYCDMQAFDFYTMAEKHGDLYYIDGRRIKTSTKFFTPILAPAMEVLKKYDFKLPRISNMKLNDYLHLVESRMNLHKPLTFHVARHSFATLSLSHHVPIENVARMLGHKDVKTTQIYAKILKSNITSQAESLARAIS